MAKTSFSRSDLPVILAFILVALGLYYGGVTTSTLVTFLMLFAIYGKLCSIFDKKREDDPKGI